MVKLQKQKGEHFSTVLMDGQKNSQLLVRSTIALYDLKIVAILLANTRKLLKFDSFESVRNRENT